MRYSDRINFITETNGGYNPDTGNHEQPTKVVETKPCNISTVGVKRSAELFGEVDTSIIIARLQRPYHNKFNRVEVPIGQYKGNYRIKERVYHRNQTAFYLEGVKS